MKELRAAKHTALRDQLHQIRQFEPAPCFVCHAPWVDKHGITDLGQDLEQMAIEAQKYHRPKRQPAGDTSPKGEAMAVRDILIILFVLLLIGVFVPGWSAYRPYTGGAGLLVLILILLFVFRVL